MDNPNNLLGVIRTIWRWRKQIIRICAATAVVSLIVCLLMPNYYRSSAVFYAASPNLAYPEPVGTESRATKYYGVKGDMDRILTIAESKSVADHLIQKYNLYNHYDIDSTNAKGASKVMKRFQKLYSVEKTKFDAIEIAIEDKDKQLAADMINDAWVKIDELGQALIKESQRTELVTRVRTVEEKDRQLQVLSDSLTKLRDRFGIFNAPTQSSHLTALITKNRGSLELNKAQLEVFAKKSGKKFRDSVVVLSARIKGAEAEIALHEAALKKFNEGMSPIEALQRVHKEASEQLGANRERKKQLAATLENDFTAIHLVSKGEVAAEKSRPRRSILMLAAVFIAFIFSVLGILLLESYRAVDWKQVIND